MVSLLAPLILGFACRLLMKYRRRTTFPLPRHRRRRQSIADNRLGFLQDAAQMISSPEALCLDLVDVLGSWDSRAGASGRQQLRKRGPLPD